MVICTLSPGQQWISSVLPFPVQDSDAAYMMKVELESKMDGLSDEIEFLRQIFDTVITVFYFSMAQKQMSYLAVVHLKTMSMLSHVVVFSYACVF